jgi:restriction system protein
MKAEALDDGRNMSLSAWLDALDDPAYEGRIISYSFPTDRHRSEYLLSIRRRSVADVRALLHHLLIPSCSLGTDEIILTHMQQQLRDDVPLRTTFQRRLFSWDLFRHRGPPPWEGNTWVLDLLPGNPRAAIETLRAYDAAHCQFLPDGRGFGLYDATAVIRAKFILSGDVQNAERALDTLTWRELEVLTAKLYAAMGYKAKLTQARGDGGRDVIAVRGKLGSKERCLVQCKHYKSPVGPADLRELLGVVAHEKANKGTLVTTSRFTSGATQFAQRNRLETINRRGLTRLLNEFLGTDWPIRLSYLIDRTAARSSDVETTDPQGAANAPR